MGSTGNRYTPPGTYTDEPLPSARVIEAAPTSLTAFVGRTRRGPIDDPIRIDGWIDYERVFGGLWEQSPLSVAVADFFRNGGGEAVIVRVFAATPAGGGASAARLRLGPLEVEAASPGGWGNDLRARIDVAEGADGLFTLSVYDRASGAFEEFSGCSPDPAKGRLIEVLAARSMLVRARPLPPDALMIATPGPAARTKWWDDPGAHAGVAPGDLGSDGMMPDDTAVMGSQAASTGLYALDKAEGFNLLCIPPLSFDQGDPGAPLIAAATDYCAARRAMLIVDPPSNWTSAAAALAAAPDPGAASPNAALYFPRIVSRSPFPSDSGKARSFAPCGAVAGVIARTDQQRGVWKAPAGLAAILTNAIGLDVDLTDARGRELNGRGINCLRALPGAGRVIWGSRTRAGANTNGSEWKYIPVRRTALFIEESIERGTRWTVFEPNEEPLWAAIRASVHAFMAGLFRRGAFQGATPREAFFVKCGTDTTSRADIDQGIINIEIGFAPDRPAEFILLRLPRPAGRIRAAEQGAEGAA